MKAKRLQSRSVEKEQRRLHVPLIDRSYGEPAPFVVVVHGPPQVSDKFVAFLLNLIGVLCYSESLLLVVWEMIFLE